MIEREESKMIPIFRFWQLGKKLRGRALYLLNPSNISRHCASYTYPWPYLIFIIIWWHNYYYLNFRWKSLVRDIIFTGVPKVAKSHLKSQVSLTALSIKQLYYTIHIIAVDGSFHERRQQNLSKDQLWEATQYRKFEERRIPMGLRGKQTLNVNTGAQEIEWVVHNPDDLWMDKVLTDKCLLDLVTRILMVCNLEKNNCGKVVGTKPYCDGWKMTM